MCLLIVDSSLRIVVILSWISRGSGRVVEISTRVTLEASSLTKEGAGGWDLVGGLLRWVEEVAPCVRAVGTPSTHIRVVLHL